MGLLFFCYLFFGVIFLVSHYLTIFTKSYLQNTQNIQSPLQTVKEHTPDLVTVLDSSFGEDSFGFTVWVLVGSYSASVHVFVRVTNSQGSSHPVRNILLTYKHIQGVVERLNIECIHGVGIILRRFVYKSLMYSIHKEFLCHW